MNILGITLGHDTSFSLIVDGVVEGVWEVERYFRQKRYKLHCLTMEPGKQMSGYQYTDVAELRMFLGLIGDVWGRKFDAVALQNQGRTQEFENLRVIMQQEGFVFDHMYNVDHHLSHAALAFYSSPFDKSTVLSFDGEGNDGYTIIFGADAEKGLEYLVNNDIQFGKNYNNLGFMIGVSAEICGTTAGKVMGLAAYGNLREEWMPYARRYVREYRKLEQGPVEGLRSFGKGHRINSVGVDEIPDLQEYVVPAEYKSKAGFFKRLMKAGTDEPKKELKIPELDNQLSMDLARTVQAAWTQEVIELLKPYSGSNLCIVGGCALNGITNYVVQEEKVFENIHLIPNPSDCGLSAGAALYVNYKYGGQKFGGYKRYFTPYLGLEPFDKADMPVLKEKYPNRTLEAADTAAVLAKLIKRDLIVGVIRGRYEIGPRALGNRSILCNPANREMRDILNAKVKHREWYRPFAPIVTAKDSARFFTNSADIPYMSVICYTREEYREALPSITHVDGSARVQTVTPEQNGFIHEMLLELEKLTGYPIVLNTSFNPKGEPILNFCSVALEMLDTTDLDMVLINNTLFCKKGRESLLELQ